MDLKKLSEPFPNEAVSWRVQGKPFERNGQWSAMALAYIDARDVMDRLDDVCGPECWQDEYTTNSNGLTICRIGIKINDEWVWKSDGAGETAVEGQKGGISDALKRAAVHWGIGRYLYRLDSPWVPCEVNTRGQQPKWKKWSVDPWSRVKNMPYHKAANERAEQALQLAIEAVRGAADIKSLQQVWSANHEYQSNADFQDAKDKRKQELTPAPNADLGGDEIPYQGAAE